MGSKPTYEELEKRIQALEEVAPESKQKTIGSESETLYRGLISEMIFGYAQHEIISRKTKPNRSATKKQGTKIQN